MNETQITDFIVNTSKDIAALWESSKSAHKRIDENDRITEGIHKLAANMENLTAQVKNLADRLEGGLREQGKRIGEVETATIKLSNLESNVSAALVKLDKIEHEPGSKWKKLVEQVTALIVAAVVGGIIMKFTS